MNCERIRQRYLESEMSYWNLTLADDEEWRVAIQLLVRADPVATRSALRHWRTLDPERARFIARAIDIADAERNTK